MLGAKGRTSERARGEKLVFVPTPALKRQGHLFMLGLCTVFRDGLCIGKTYFFLTITVFYIQNSTLFYLPCFTLEYILDFTVVLNYKAVFLFLLAE